MLRRVCKKVRDGISDGVQNNRFATGVELRFRMTDGAVDLTLSSELVAESATVHIFSDLFREAGNILRKMSVPKYDDPYRISDRHGEAAAACGGVSSAL